MLVMLTVAEALPDWIMEFVVALIGLFVVGNSMVGSICDGREQ